ncbi:hypothetical protein WKI65_44450 [Streptomyces sp. MS1.AVA.3]
MSPDVAWGGAWRHEECGAWGDAVWEDEDTAYSGHECDQDEVLEMDGAQV